MARQLALQSLMITGATRLRRLTQWRPLRQLGVLALVTALGAWSTFRHAAGLGVDYILNQQLQSHEAVMQGIAGNPFEYRILSEWFIELARSLFAAWLPPATADYWALVGTRGVIDVLVLLAAYALYRNLKLELPAALLGVGLLTWGMSLARYDANLSHNTFADVLFYLVACSLLLRRKNWLVVPLTVLAALNRETSGLIPVLCLAFAQLESDPHARRELRMVGAVSLALFATVFVSLHLYFGEQAFISAYGHMPGLDLLGFNLFRMITWEELLAVLDVVPIVALLGFRLWPKELKMIFWSVVPAWFVIHLLMAIVAESRLVLTPQAIAFIPGALFALRGAMIGVSTAGVKGPVTESTG